jgi:hypothetical protein
MATTTNKVWQKDSDTTAIDQDAFINAFLDDLDASLFGIGANSAKPGSPDEGDTFYDTDASRFIKYNGSAWVQLMPDAANAIDSDHYVDGSIDAVHLAADVITGAKIADNAIDSEHYTDGSIDNAHIADDAIDSEHYADGSIDNAHIADDAIDSEHYADGSIDNAHIADDAIDSEHYAAGSIDNAHLAADAVTGAKIADDAIDSEHYVGASIDAAHIASSAVTTAKVNADAITGAKIADDALDSEHYADGSIDNAHIADDAIDSEHYADGSIDSAHLADNAVTLGKLSDGTQGGILYYASGGAPTELAASTDGYFLKTQGTSANPVWAASSAGISQASESALEGETNEDTYAPPDLIRHSPGVAKFWVKAGYDASILGSYNVTSCTDVGTGLITVVIADDFGDASWAVTACTETPYTRSTNVGVPSGSGQLAISVAMRITDNNGTLSDGTYLHVAGWGTQ